MGRKQRGSLNTRKTRCVECGKSYPAYRMFSEEGANVCWPSCNENALWEAREIPWPKAELQKPDGAWKGPKAEAD